MDTNKIIRRESKRYNLSEEEVLRLALALLLEADEATLNEVNKSYCITDKELKHAPITFSVDDDLRDVDWGDEDEDYSYLEDGK